MAIPSASELMQPVLAIHSDGASLRLEQVAELVADKIELSSDDRARRQTSGDYVFTQRVGWARTYLEQRGMLARLERGQMSITRSGREALDLGQPISPPQADWAGKPVTRESVLAAIELFRTHDRDELLREHGFRRALDYVVDYEGEQYDAKALYGIAYSLDYPDEERLRNRGLQGGREVNLKLEQLGFPIKSLRAGNPTADGPRPEARVWIIRGGADGENEDVARSENVVLIGWSALGEITPELSRQQLRDRIRTTFNEHREKSLDAQASSIYRFIHEVADGDLVVLPLQSDRRKASIGVIEGAFRYRTDGPFEGRDAHYQRPVRWLAWGVPYDSFDDDLQSAFGVPGTLSEITKPDAVARLLRNRPGRTRRVWWVCQGQTYDSARALGVLWAPKVAKDGSGRAFWRALEDAHVGDLVLHYADSHIRAISTVAEPALDAPRPQGLSGDWVDGDGWLVRTEYRELEHAFALAEIPEDWRIAEGGPFTKQGSVQQGYFFPLSDGFVNRVAERFPQLSLQPSPARGGHTPLITYVEPSFGAIQSAIHDLKLRISERTLRRYHVSLKTRGFVVLAGVSGGGKTWLAEAYADVVGAEAIVVPVAPNWTTNEDLLGYLNPIDNEYRHTEFSLFLQRAAAEFAQAQAASQEPRPFHLILDELNLARVEYYFAKFLSAMEARARYGTARVALSEDLELQLTPNLKVVGTVNVDETTFGFADKVYDRAQLVELEAPREALSEHMADEPFHDALLGAWDAVHEVAPFAFRVIDEVRAYVAESSLLGVSWQIALDDQLLQKVLPKIKGTDPKLKDALETFTAAAHGVFPLSYAKASRMLEDFQVHGFVSYF